MTEGINKRNEHWAVRFYTLWTGQALSLLGSQLVHSPMRWASSSGF